MAIHSTIEAKHRLVRLVYAEAVVFREWVTVMSRLLRDPAYQPGFGFVVDRRLAFTPTTDYVRSAVRYLRRNRDRVRGSRWAIVIGSPVCFGPVLHGQILAKGLPLKTCIFTNIDAAEAWVRNPAPADLPPIARSISRFRAPRPRFE